MCRATLFNHLRTQRFPTGQLRPWFHEFCHQTVFCTVASARVEIARWQQMAAPSRCCAEGKADPRLAGLIFGALEGSSQNLHRALRAIRHRGPLELGYRREENSWSATARSTCCGQLRALEGLSNHGTRQLYGVQWISEPDASDGTFHFVFSRRIFGGMQERGGGRLLWGMSIAATSRCPRGQCRARSLAQIIPPLRPSGPAFAHPALWALGSGLWALGQR